MNNSTYTIGQLAKAADVASSTLRYYERRGLLAADGRTGGNYRIYDETTLARVRFIRAAQATGFTLDDITILLSLQDGTTCPCGEVKELLEQRLDDVQKRLKELRELHKVLKDSLSICKKSDADADCGVIDNLTKSAKPQN